MSVLERVHMPSLGGAIEWLDSEPLDPAGQVVLVNFWTWTCINWLRREPYVRAWSRAYRDDGLVVIGVHTPEFSFENEIDGVRHEAKEREIDYRSRSTTTTRSGAPSPTATSRRSTSSTRTASSATTTSAKGATSGTRVSPPDRETTVVAVAQGRRLARVAHVIGVARERGLLDVRAGRLAALYESEV